MYKPCSFALWICSPLMKTAWRKKFFYKLLATKFHYKKKKRFPAMCYICTVSVGLFSQETSGRLTYGCSPFEQENRFVERELHSNRNFRIFWLNYKQPLSFFSFWMKRPRNLIIFFFLNSLFSNSLVYHKIIKLWWKYLTQNFQRTSHKFYQYTLLGAFLEIITGKILSLNRFRGSNRFSQP